MGSWFHAPVLTPAQGALLFAVLIAVQIIPYVFNRVNRKKHDPYDNPEGWQ